MGVSWLGGSVAYSAIQAARLGLRSTISAEGTLLLCSRTGVPTPKKSTCNCSRPAL